MAKKIRNNVDLIVNLMNFSPVGAMGQLFIIDAIRKHADAVADPANHQKLRESMKDGMFSADGWIEAARHIKAECDKFYNR